MESRMDKKTEMYIETGNVHGGLFYTRILHVEEQRPQKHFFKFRLRYVEILGLLRGLRTISKSRR